MVTHEARHAAWADRVVFLRDGRLVDESAPLAAETLLTGITGGHGGAGDGTGTL